MKDQLIKLLEASGANFDQKAFSQLEFVLDDEFLVDLNLLFDDELFDYKVERKLAKSEADLTENFVIMMDGEALYVRRVGGNYIDLQNNSLAVRDMAGSEILVLNENPKPKSEGDFLEILYGMFPKVNFLLFLSVPFVLIPAFYANLFNTRMIHNDVVSTLLFVTLLFTGLWVLDYVLKSYVKNAEFKVVDVNTLKLERYLFYLIPYFKKPGAISKVNMIVSNKKTVWTGLSGSLTDVATFVILFLAIFILLGGLSFFLLLFYFVIALLAIYLRYRNYRMYIESEAIGQDLLLERMSYFRNSRQLYFFNTNTMVGHFSDVCKRSMKTDHDVGWFNFEWEEFVRYSSFLSSFVLFTVIFYESKMDAGVFTVLIALLIINSRLSASVVGLVTKANHLLVGTYHIRQAAQELFDNLNVVSFKSGFHLNHLDKISLHDVSISVEGRQILKNTTMNFEKGCIYGIWGGIGVGKSTLLNCLTQDHHEYTGSIVFNDLYNVNDVESGFFSNQTVYLNPFSDLVKGSIFYNFAIRGCRDKDRIVFVLKSIFPGQVIDYDFVYQKDVTHIPMSTGQKRKLLLYMSLNKHKSLIVLDEAFINISNLDIVNIVKYIQVELKNSVVIVVSHDKAVLNLTNNVYEFKDQQLQMVKNAVVKLTPNVMR